MSTGEGAAARPQPAFTPRVENFRGDFARLSAMMIEAWSRRKEQALVYSEPYLRSCFEFPGMSAGLAPAIYDRGDPLAFIAGFPRRLKLHGRELNAVRASMLTTSASLNAAGWGIIVWSALVRRARALGFEAMVNYAVAGLGVDAFFLGCGRRLELTTTHVFRARCLASLLRPGDDAPPHGGDADPRLFAAEANALAARTPIARVWSEAEAEWEIRSRYGAVAVQHTCGGRTGLAAGCVMQLAGAGAPKCVLVENVLWGGLEGTERQELLRAFLARAQGAGAGMAIVPCLNSFDTAPFREAGFRLSRRIIDIFISVWPGAASIQPAESIATDVF